MSTGSPAADENRYDAVPYPNLSHPFTHPRRLEAIAALFGMEPAPITRCRVLELGCAAGANLIPQAVEFPESRFVGADLSGRQIADGQQTIAALGLPNIELRQADLMTIDESWGQFDYIISHGLFSWVPPHVQDKLLEISARNLSPSGVALVSYNTYPGWHLVTPIRDLMNFHTAGFNDPREKIAQANAILNLMVEVSSAESLIGKMFQEEQRTLKWVGDDSYFFHDHLEPDNHPVYFHEFMRRAEARGLQYLAESEIRTMLLQNQSEKVRTTFANLPILQTEQYLDFVSGRRFRTTLLCHQAVALERCLDPAMMRRFHFALPGNLEAANVDIRKEGPAEFTHNGNTLTTSDRLTKATLMYLKEVYPAYVPFRQLCATSLARIGQLSPSMLGNPGASTEVLAADLLKSYLFGFLHISLHPPRCAGKLNARPLASPLARWQAEHGLPLTNLHHQRVNMDPLGRRIVYRLDGRHDRTALTDCVQEAIASGEFTVTDRNHEDRPLKQVPNHAVANILDLKLNEIATAALLVG
jgi:methyltransferase-like protein/trans-aconitate methyltransferase